MKVPHLENVVASEKGERRAWYRPLRALTRALTAGLTFGDGTDLDNLAGKWLLCTSDPTPGTEFVVTHDLGVIPVGFILTTPPASGVVNNGATAWTTSNIYLTCTSASQTFRIFLLVPPRT